MTESSFELILNCARALEIPSFRPRQLSSQRLFRIQYLHFGFHADSLARPSNADALERLAHATRQSSPLMASPLQALIGCSAAITSTLCRLLQWDNSYNCFQSIGWLDTRIPPHKTCCNWASRELEPSTICYGHLLEQAC